MDERVDVVVIGAGVAGLAAAAVLAKNGRRIVVLEARGRVGGRIWSERVAGWPLPVELGAEFVHGENPALARWLRAARAQRMPVPEQHWLCAADRRVSVPDAWERIDGVMNRIGPRFQRSFGEWLEQHGWEMAPADAVLARGFVEGFHAAPLARMSARTLYRAAQGEAEEQARLRGGYGDVVAELVRGLPREQMSVRLNTVASAVQWRRCAVSVRAGQQVWRARAALVTVPLGVLQAPAGQPGAIRFHPSLTQKQRVWRALGSGHAIRMVLRLRADVWRRGLLPAELRAERGEAFGFLHSAEPEFPVWWAEPPHPVLVGWAGGRAAERVSGATPAEIYRAARRTLAKLLSCPPGGIDRAVVAWRTHDWSADPFTRGAYSYSVAGQETLPSELARPVAGTLFFAGEATADALELGTVHGALASGERAAKEILREMD